MQMETLDSNMSNTGPGLVRIHIEPTPLRHGRHLGGLRYSQKGGWNENRHKELWSPHPVECARRNCLASFGILSGWISQEANQGRAKK